jgi:hypothetical protein
MHSLFTQSTENLTGLLWWGPFLGGLITILIVLVVTCIVIKILRRVTREKEALGNNAQDQTLRFIIK